VVIGQGIFNALFILSFSSPTALFVKEIMRISGADVSVPADLFDDVVYGEKSISSQDAEKVLNTYVSAYEAYRETKKKRRIKTA
jgi:hypothetical protein